MKTKKQLIKSWLLMMLMLIGAGGNVWADSYEIVFKSATSDSNTDLGAAPSVSDVVESGGDYIKSFSNCSKLFVGESGIKLGNSRNPGTINFTLNANYQENIKSIQVVSAKYGSDTGTLDLYSGTSTPLKKDIKPGVVYTHVFDTPTTVSSIKLVTSAKRAYITSITITTESSSREDPQITFNNGSVKVGNTLDLSTLFTSNSEGSVTYSITSGGSCASIVGSTLTGVAAGSVTVKAEQAENGNYNAGESTATIIVTNPALSSIAITTAPTKTSYYEGETFDANGMVVTATFDDSSEEDVTASCTFIPDGALTTSDTEVTVSYTRNSVTKTAKQAITVNTFVQPTTIEASLNNTFFGCDAFSSWNNSLKENYSGTKDNVIIKYAKGSSQYMYIQTGGIRMYDGNTLTFTAPEGYNIVKIELNGEIGFTTNLTAEGLSNGTWTGEASEVVISGNSNKKNISGATITISKLSDVKAPTFSPAEGTYEGTQSVEISCITQGATIYYTTDGSDPTSSSTLYSDAVTIDQSCTLKAIAIKDGESSAVASAYYEILDPNRPGTENNPYTVAQALAYIETLGAASSDEVYVAGVITKVEKFYSDFNSIDYYISDKNVENELLVYSGKGLQGENFSAITDLQVSDEVVVKGKLKNYKGTPEFDKTSSIVSLVRKEKVEASLAFSSETATAVRGQSYSTPDLTNPNNLAVVYSSSNEAVATVDAETGVVTLLKAGETTITATFDGNSDYKPGSASYTLTVTVPSHTATFFVNGQQTGEGLSVAEDAAITFPETPADIEGKTFVGWVTEVINGETDEAPAFVTSATMGTSDLKYYAVFANQEGESKTATLTEAEIKGNFSNNAMGYNDDEKSYEDTADGITWAAKAYNTKDVPWIQIRKNATAAYLKISSENNISKINLTLTNATVETGESTSDITKHGAYNGKILLLTEPAGNANEGTLGSSSEVSNNTLTVVPTSEVNELYIQTTTAARIWNVEVTYGSITTSNYCTTVPVPVPEVTLAEGKYTAAQTVSMTASQGATIYYTLNGGAKQEYTEPLTIESNTTLVAWAEKDGLESEKVTKNYTIVITIAGDPANFEDGFYQIKNNDNEKYVNVAGRKTVTFVGESDAASMPGTVIKLKTGKNGQVEVLRSQGVDVPGYATRALNYVDKFFNLAVEKLELQDLLGHSGAQSILTKFHDSFDEHLYIEQVENGYRIYGKTPSMTPVVEFYQEHKAEIDYKLPGLEDAINKAINKVIDKVGHGYSLKDSFSIHEIWERMGGEESNLTEPVEGNEESIARFYTGVLTSETNVWNFAYEAAMKYVEIVEKKDKFIELKKQYPEYFKYYEMAKRVRPDFKYYIAQKDDQIDFISEGNIDIAKNDARAIWTIEKRTDFKVEVPEANKKVNVDPRNGGTDYFTTLYTDFGYTLPDGVRAYQITGVKLDEKNETKASAIRKEIKGNVPAQTPVLLVSKSTEVVLQLAEDGTALDENALYGNDYLIEKDGLKNTILKTIFETVESNYESLYNNYMKDYEHLMLLTAGTVNNKYFFGLSKNDDLAASSNYNNGAVMLLGHDDDLGIRFHYATNEDLKGNEAFMLDESGKLEDIVLFIIGDVNRDGQVSIADVTATVNIILGKDKPEDNYDYDAANVNMDELISIADVTALVNIILGKPNN